MDVSIAISFALPVLVWLVLWVSLPNSSFKMDPVQYPGLFMGIITHYHRVFFTMAMLAFVSIFISAWLGMNMAICPLAMSMIYGVAFNGFIVLFYEGFLAKSTSYTTGKYALVLALGTSSFALFSVGELCLLFRILEYNRHL